MSNMHTVTVQFMWWALALIVLGSTVPTIGGCLNPGPGAKVLSPNTAVKGVLGSNDESQSSTDIRTGDIGGNGDSIALWLAIVSLGAATLSYPVSRAIRTRMQGLNK
jgi:hypothetical protein